MEEQRQRGLSRRTCAVAEAGADTTSGCPPSPAAESPGSMGNRIRCGSPYSCCRRGAGQAAARWRGDVATQQALHRGGLLRRPKAAAPRSRPRSRPRRTWMRSPLPSPKGRYTLPSSPLKYDMFSTTATQGTCRAGQTHVGGENRNSFGPARHLGPHGTAPLVCSSPATAAGAPTISLANMRMPLATSMKASFWGVVTMTAAEKATDWGGRWRSGRVRVA